MTALINPRNGQMITVPDTESESYVSQGWVRPGTPAPAEPALDSLTVPQLRDFAADNGVTLERLKRKPDIIARIESALAQA